MKKYILKVILLIIITSCSEYSEQEMKPENITVRQIENITNVFLNSQEQKESNSNQKSNAFDTGAYLVDIEAGMDDYMENGDVGNAIEVGTLASIKGTSKPQHFSHGDNSVDDVVNINNDYDYVGKYHAEMLKSGIDDNKDVLYPNGVFNYYNALTFANNFLAARNIYLDPANTFTESEFNTFYANVKSRLQNNNNLLSKVILQYKNENRISEVEAQILHMYFTAQESSNTLNAYIQYSIQVENTVVYSNLPEKSKKLLLFAMATARHDINFWSPY